MAVKPRQIRRPMGEDRERIGVMQIADDGRYCNGKDFFYGLSISFWLGICMEEIAKKEKD